MEYETASQSRYRCRLGWGQEGVELALQLGGVLVVVDALRFSTAATAAVHHGALVYPCAPGPEAEVQAERIGGELASHLVGSRFSLSPSCYEGVPPGTRIVLPSPNGSAFSYAARALPHVFVGALVNARAVTQAVETILQETTYGVTVLACGERRSPLNGGGSVRFALEDYLGAGAILSGLSPDSSPEAQLCEAAYRSSRGQITELLWGCTSGWELREKGYGDDVRLASTLDLYDTVPAMVGDYLAAFPG